MKIPDPLFRRVDPAPERGKPGEDVMACSYVGTAPGFEDVTLVTTRENPDSPRFPIWKYTHPVVGTTQTWPEMWKLIVQAGLQPD